MKLLSIFLLLVLCASLCGSVQAQDIISEKRLENGTIIQTMSDKSLNLVSKNAISNVSFVFEVKDDKGWHLLVPSTSFKAGMQERGNEIPMPFLVLESELADFINSASSDNFTHFSWFRVVSDWLDVKLWQGLRFNKIREVDVLLTPSFRIGNLYGGVSYGDMVNSGKYSNTLLKEGINVIRFEHEIEFCKHWRYFNAGRVN